MSRKNGTIRRVIIAHYYQPSTAATNRIIAYAKGFVSADVEVYVVLGSEGHIKEPVINGAHVVMVNVSKHYQLTSKMAKEIKRLYDFGHTAVFVYGSPLLCLYLPKRKYNVFVECTEVPFFGRQKKIGISIKEGLKRLLARQALGMMVISKALKTYFTNQGIKNVAIINMFVDSTRFEIIHNSEQKYIAYCGTISPYKDGVDCLIRSFAIFHQEHSDYILKLIGGFENEAAEKCLTAIVNELCISNYVEFTGRIQPSEMPALLCGAHMLALDRPDNEQAKYGFPTKLGEYLATGKPVVVTNVGEIGCFLKDMENCRMAKPDDEKDFAAKMSWVANNYEKALRLGEKGKQLTLAEFSSLEQSKKALLFMEKVVGQYNK